MSWVGSKLCPREMGCWAGGKKGFWQSAPWRASSDCVHMSLGDSRGHLSQSRISGWQCLWHGHSQMLSARLSPLVR